MFKYKVGMYGGCFDPLHLGHINNILQASAMCETLHLMLCYNKVRDRIDYRLRYRWLLDTCKHLPNVVIHCIEDTDDTKESYDWQKGATAIKQAIGTEINIVFAGSDYQDGSLFKELYPQSEIWYFSRSIVPISSTEIFDDPMRYWEYIPKVAQSYFCKKVIIIGGESTGKSTLIRNLALIYNTTYVEEYGRFTCERAGGEDFMTIEDLQENLIMQRANIYKAEENANKIFFVDTDALTTAFYAGLLSADERYNTNDLAYNIATTLVGDLVLFLEPTVPFVQDGTRNEEIMADRQKYSDILKSYYDRAGVQYICIRGDNYASRLAQAKMVIKYHCGV